jgi:hypothetical protein
MTFSEYTLENAPIIEGPECPECSTLMYLALIEPEKPGCDRCTFECPRCQHVEPPWSRSERSLRERHEGCPKGAIQFRARPDY